MKKIIAYITLLLLIIPFTVKANEHSFSFLKNMGILLKNDKIILSFGQPDSEVYIDGELADDYYVFEDNATILTAPDDLLYIDYNKDEKKYYFTRLKHEPKIYCYMTSYWDSDEPSEYDLETYEKELCDEYLEEGSIYKGGNIIYISNGYASSLFYDKAGTLLVDTLYNNFYMMPILEGENEYWKYTSTDYNSYSYLSPTFQEVTYQKPNFILECNNSVINYGEETTCEIFIESNYKLNKISFNLKTNNMELKSVTFPAGIESIEGDKEYNLKISDGFPQTLSKRSLMSFSIAGKENNTYTDELQVLEISYEDEAVIGKYSVLDGTFEIKEVKEISAPEEIKEETNPNTSRYIPITILLVSLSIVIYCLYEIKRKGIKY